MCDCIKTALMRNSGMSVCGADGELLQSKQFSTYAFIHRKWDKAQTKPIPCVFCPFCGEKYELPKWVNCAVRKPTWEDASAAGEVWYSSNGRDIFRQDFRVVAAQENIPLDKQHLNLWFAISKNLKPFPPNPPKVTA